MSKRVYVGNLSYTTGEETLKDLFSRYGNLLSVSLIIDRDTQQSKGFAFIEFENEADADAAISAQSGKELDGRRIRVSLAEEKQEKAPRKFSGEKKDFRTSRKNHDDRRY